MSYALAIDQSTQGTKALVFDNILNVVGRAYIPHRQIISEQGFVSHDGNEIYANVLKAVATAIKDGGIDPSDIACAGLCNQRETTVIWDEDGAPLNDAVVWQCDRARNIADRLTKYSSDIKSISGMPLSPFFSAAKMKWLLDNTELPRKYYIGTIDSYLIYRLTCGKRYVTDISNACRTQLLDISNRCWSDKLCDAFGIQKGMLADVLPNNGDFGESDFGGIFKNKIPICASFGDSQAALFAQNCRVEGAVKATYGTGSSVMMNIGRNRKDSSCGLVTSIAWTIDGKTDYCLEGNVNYSGAVVSWLKNDLKLISDESEIEPLIANANASDNTVLIPSFGGLSAPFWCDMPAAFYGMSRATGRAELVKAAINSIAYQINAVLQAMINDIGKPPRFLRADGAPTRNKYLMQLQSDLLGAPVEIPSFAELSAAGAAILAGIKGGIMCDGVFQKLQYTSVLPCASTQGYDDWVKAVEALSAIRPI